MYVSETVARFDLQAARLVLLWVLGKPHDPLHPDAIQAAVEAAEAAETRLDESHVSTPPLPLPAERDACMDLAVRELAQEIRRQRREPPDPGAVVAQALEGR